MTRQLSGSQLKNLSCSIVLWNLRFWDQQKKTIDYEVRLGLILALLLSCCVNLRHVTQYFCA